MANGLQQVPIPRQRPANLVRQGGDEDQQVVVTVSSQVLP